jgi:hypothetical protein
VAIVSAFGRRGLQGHAPLAARRTVRGEGNETLHHFITALDLGYLTQEEFDELVALLEPVRTNVFNLMMRFRG